MKKAQKIASIIFLFSTFLFSTSFAEAAKQKVRVIAEHANIRARASLESSVIATVSGGTILDVISKDGKWFLISLPPDDKGFVITGYIHSSIVEIIEVSTTDEKKPEEKPTEETTPKVEKKEEAIGPPPLPPPLPTKPTRQPSMPKQETSLKPWAIGVGASLNQYWSCWEYEYYFHDMYHSAVNWHIYPRLLFSGFIEKNSLFKLGPVSVGLKADFFYGFMGGTKWDGEPDDLTISTGGSTMAADLIIKFMYQTPSVNPYVGVGPQFIVFSSNGEGNEFSDHYDMPWKESIFAIPICFGIEFAPGNLYFSIEYRHALVLGGTITDWDPVWNPSDIWFYQSTIGRALLAQIGIRL